MRVISERTTVTTLTGEHDLFTKHRVLETLACARQWPNVIVDLTPCDFLDSTVVRALIAARGVQLPGERFELVAPQDNGFVSHVLRLIGVPDIIPTHDCLADAQLSVGEPHPFALSPSEGPDPAL
jgi:anti-anti-sigma regulatory factor